MTARAGQESEFFWCIGIGASAGGLEAVSLLLSCLPADLPAAIVIAQHLSPKAKSVLAELLGRKSNRNVVVAEDGMKIVSGTVFVIPPGRDLRLEKGRVVLTHTNEEIRPKPSIDALFKSLASNFGRHAVGIILSGTGSDGSHGIEAIRVRGGLTIAQDNISAKYDGMPRSAVDTGAVDFVLAPDQIAEQLPEILKKHAVLQADTPQSTLTDVELVTAILQYLKDNHGVDFRDYKTPTVHRRIEKRMAALGLSNLSSYFNYLRSQPGEKERLASEMLISVTAFYRDSESYSALRQVLKQRLLSRPKIHDDEFRCWVAGCATGEEAYSLCFLLLDLTEELRRSITIKIFATDLDYEATMHARAGHYTEDDIAHLPPTFLERYFDRKRDGYEVKKFVRDRVFFAHQDLVQQPPFVKIDLVSCRNVLIYFESRLQEKIFSMFHYALKPKGLLFLGKSETPMQSGELFLAVDRQARIFERANVAARVVVPLTTEARNRQTAQSSGENRIAAQATRTTERVRVRDLAINGIFDQLHLSAAIVDSDGNVLETIGDCSDLLKFPAGAVDFRITSLLPPTMAVEIALLLTKLQREGHPLRSHPIKVELGKKKRIVTARLHAVIAAGESEAKAYLIAFEQKPLPIKRRRREGTAATATAGEGEWTGDRSQYIAELESELTATREHLQSASEELSVTNEELQSINEEMASTNEELQATNEELETTNEELQATNEELTTLNEELNVKSNEIRLVNASLENVQASIGSPLVVVDAMLRVVRFNGLAQRVFDINASHIGQPISKLSCHYEIRDFLLHLNASVDRGDISEVLIETPRSIYQLHILPCRDEAGKNVGAILIFFDNTQLIQAESKLKNNESRMRSILDGSPALIALKDTLGRYLMVNRSFLNILQLNATEVIGKTDREILSEAVANQFRDAELEVLLKRTPIEVQESIDQKNGPATVLLSNRFPLYENKNDRSPFAIGVVSIDISQQVRAQNQLAESESRYKAVVEDQAVFVCRYDASGKLTFVNTAYMNFFGGSRSTHLGQSFFRQLSSEESVTGQELVRSLSPAHPLGQHEHLVNRNGESARWVRWLHRGIFAENGDLREIQSVGFDITEFKEQAAELGQREKLYASILNFTSDFLMVFRVDEHNQFILESINKSAERAFSLSASSFLGMPLEKVADRSRYNEIPR